MGPRLEVLQMWGVGTMQVHKICNHKPFVQESSRGSGFIFELDWKPI